MHSSNEIRVALIGAGPMGRNHVAVLNRIPGVSLVAVADPAFQLNPDLLALPESVATFTDVRDMLAECRPESVHIVSPPETHYSIAMDAVAAGCHVYVEKPFCTNPADAVTLLDSARAAGVKVCAGHQLTHHPIATKMWSRLDTVGKAVHVEAGFCFQPVRRDRTGALMRAHDQLMDVLPHPVYLVLRALRQTVGDSETLELTAVESPAPGEIRVLGRYGNCTMSLLVSLRGRPVDTFLSVRGNRGTLHADLVLGSIRGQIAPRKSAPTVIMRPFAMALQETFGTINSLGTVVFSKAARTGGLEQLCRAFYSYIKDAGSAPQTMDEIVQTVQACSEIENAAVEAAKRTDQQAEKSLREKEANLPAISNVKRLVTVTGASGFLGKAVVARLRNSGFQVRGLVRRMPSMSERCPGVDYVAVDLAHDVVESALTDTDTVIHLAAETAGGKDLHQRNSIDATTGLLESCSKSGVKRLINISSIAVVQADASEPIDESSPVETDLEKRGPYVWGKARAESEAIRLGDEFGIEVVTIRPGPLVDFANFEPPGRLGRSIGSLLVAIGPRSGKLPVCDINTMARLIEIYVRDISAGPRLVHALEPGLPSRAELVQRMKDCFPGTKVIWIPRWFLVLSSKTIAATMRVLGRKPLDIYSAFRAGAYDTSAVQSVFAKETGLQGSTTGQ